MSKANVYNWIKNRVTVGSSLPVLELYELFWFIKEKPNTETHENTYVFTMVSREPRLLAGIAVSCEKDSSYIQKIVDDGPDAAYYCTDGYVGYLLMSQLSLEDICLSFCRDTALEILALRQQGGGFLPCFTTKILRIYSSRFNWYINRCGLSGNTYPEYP